MPAGTSNSKTATDPADRSPSIRNRIASGPTVIGSRVLVVIVLAPSIGWSSDLTVHAILRSVKSLYEWQEKRDPLTSGQRARAGNPTRRRVPIGRRPQQPAQRRRRDARSPPTRR